MSRRKKIGKVMLFDEFSRKMGFVAFRVFVRHGYTRLFGMNVFVQNSKKLRIEFTMDDSCRDTAGIWLSDFKCKRALDLKRDEGEFELEDLPREFKEAVIDRCVKKSMPVYVNNQLFIPAAGSLEELAIVIDLEDAGL